MKNKLIQTSVQVMAVPELWETICGEKQNTYRIELRVGYYF